MIILLGYLVGCVLLKVLGHPSDRWNKCLSAKFNSMSFLSIVMWENNFDDFETNEFEDLDPKNPIPFLCASIPKT